MKKVWAVIRGFLMLVGVAVVALAVVGAFVLRDKAPVLPDRMVLALTLFGTPEDAPDLSGWISRFVPVEPSLREVTEAVYKAAGDPRVEALAVRLNGGDYNWADVQELRSAVLAFKESGKPSYVYAESYGDLYPGMAVYYLASAFDEVWLQPVGSVSITGFHAEMPYFRKTLEMVGVKPDILQKGEYKTAPESALLDGMSDAQRETLHGILSSMMGDFFEAVASGREMPVASIGPLIDSAPYTADEAKERKLVDTIGYEDELLDKIFEDEGRQMVDALSYFYEVEPPVKLFKKSHQPIKNVHETMAVAIVYINGLIVSGGDGGLMGGEDVVFADDVAGAIQEAAEDEDVRAIVLRVVSPGGSPSASETIRRAVELARQKGKYVVVSMGAEAASGGYWVSVDADRIYAQNGTLTGSIGVFGGKASFDGLWKKIGVNWDGVEIGANASLWSMNRPYDSAQKETVGRMLDQIYDAFVDRVAKGRKFSRDVVESMAGGRVWTGRQAKERGLVDEVGGLRQALEDVAKHLGTDYANLEVYTLPQYSDPVDELRAYLFGSTGVFGFVGPVLRQIRLAERPMQGVVYNPYIEGFAKGR